MAKSLIKRAKKELVDDGEGELEAGNYELTSALALVAIAEQLERIAKELKRMNDKTR